jgi:regulator of replication initiation timing
MTIKQVSDREIALQAQLAAMTASRDDYQQAADKMAWEHKVERDQLNADVSMNMRVAVRAIDECVELKVERDTLRQHIKHIGNDALRSENHELRQQLAESQAEVSRLEPLQFRQAPCHKFCEAMAFTIEIRNLKKQLAEAQKDAERYRYLFKNNQPSVQFARAYARWDGSDGKDGFDAVIDAAIAAMKGTAC